MTYSAVKAKLIYRESQFLYIKIVIKGNRQPRPPSQRFLNKVHLIGSRRYCRLRVKRPDYENELVAGGWDRHAGPLLTPPITLECRPTDSPPSLQPSSFFFCLSFSLLLLLLLLLLFLFSFFLAFFLSSVVEMMMNFERNRWKMRVRAGGSWTRLPPSFPPPPPSPSAGLPPPPQSTTLQCNH